MINVTYKAVLASAKKAVAERGGGYVNPRNPATGLCEYVTWANGQGTPSCIVGYILSDLGLSLDTFEPYETGPGSAILTGEAKLGHLVFEDAANTFLTKAQAEQDELAPWGMAVLIAKDYVRRQHNL